MDAAIIVASVNGLNALGLNALGLKMVAGVRSRRSKVCMTVSLIFSTRLWFYFFNNFYLSITHLRPMAPMQVLAFGLGTQETTLDLGLRR
ncbi:hypothetical protein R50073_43190 [Maricurvus nonylphenolicus]